MSEPLAYPLSWPHGKPRTPWQKRKHGQFAADKRAITRAAAVKRVRLEVERLGGSNVLVSTDIELRRDGMPRLDRAERTDPGICVYFSMGGRSYAMACDTYDQLAQNIAAVANHIAATRAIARYGVASAAETLQAFIALPSPKKAHEILGVEPNASPEQVNRAWKAKIVANHPDRTGSHHAAAEINAARDAMLNGATA